MGRRDAVFAAAGAGAVIAIVAGAPTVWEWLCDHSRLITRIDRLIQQAAK